MTSDFPLRANSNPRCCGNRVNSGRYSFAGASVIGKPGFEVAAPEKEIDPLLEAELDKGEAAVIQLALETNNSEVLIDEKRARRIAVSVYGLNVLGIGGLLLRAKRSGLISEVKPLFEQIRANGYFISNRLMEGILGAAGES